LPLSSRQTPTQSSRRSTVAPASSTRCAGTICTWAVMGQKRR